MPGTTKTPNLADALEEEWETVKTGLGIAYDPEAEGALVGSYLGSVEKELTDSDGEVRNQTVHQFSPKNEPDVIKFIWGGYELDEAMSTISQGTLCRISFAGRGQFKAKDGKPRQIKHYKVQTSKA